MRPSLIGSQGGAAVRIVQGSALPRLERNDIIIGTRGTGCVCVCVWSFVCEGGVCVGGGVVVSQGQEFTCHAQ